MPVWHNCNTKPITTSSLSASWAGLFAQLPQSELEGLDPSCRRFRLENGDSIAEKDEVSIYVAHIDPSPPSPTHWSNTFHNSLGIGEIFTQKCIAIGLANYILLTHRPPPFSGSRYSDLPARPSWKTQRTRLGGTSSISWANVSR